MEKVYDEPLTAIKQLSMLKNACTKVEELGLNIQLRKKGINFYNNKLLIGKLTYDSCEEAYVGYISPIFHDIKETSLKRNLKKILLDEGFAITGAIKV